MYTTSQIRKSDFNKVCRICIQTEIPNMYFIHESTIIQMFQYCYNTLPINENDGLPSQICENCFIKLMDSFQFKQLCENSHRVLLEIRDENDTKDNLDLFIKQEVIEQIDIKPTFIKNDSDCDNDDVQEYIVANDDIDEDGNDNVDEEDVDEDGEIWDDECLSNGIESSKTKRSQLDPNKCDPKTLTCKSCNKKLASTRSLIQHLRLHESSDENRIKYKCDHCDVSYCELRSLGRHVLAKHKPTLIPCTVCNKKFAIQLQLDRHMKFIHRQKKDHVCKQCGKIFTKNYHLMRHEKCHATERIYPCMQCDNKSFRNEVSLRCHYRSCHSANKKREVCTLCGKDVYNIKQHIAQVHSDEHVTCPYCYKEFHNKSSFELHRKRKHGDPNEMSKRPFLCSICGKGSISKSALKKHYQYIHTVGEHYPCPICNKKFKAEQAVKTHVRYTHKPENRHSCTICSKSFPISSRLKFHMRVHTGEKPYACKLCNKAFGKSNTLKNHIMKVHDSFDSEKPVKNELMHNVRTNNRTTRRIAILSKNFKHNVNDRV